MTKCEQCGATIDPMAMACPYCHLTTAAGVVASQRGQAAAQAHAQWAAAVEFQKRQATIQQIEGAATSSVVWSAIGVVLCCLPLGVVGIVQAMRARSSAVAQKAEIPGRATIGLVLGGLSCAMSVGLVVFSLLRADTKDQQAAARIAELDKQIGAKSAAASLDHTVACGLAEQNALRVGYRGQLGRELGSFSCPGRLTQTATTAQLEDFAFNYDSDAFKVFVCFKRGDKWYASEMREDACGSTSDTVDTSASATAGAASATATPSSSHHGASQHHAH